MAAEDATAAVDTAPAVVVAVAVVEVEFAIDIAVAVAVVAASNKAAAVAVRSDWVNHSSAIAVVRASVVVFAVANADAAEAVVGIFARAGIGSVVVEKDVRYCRAAVDAVEP